MNKNYSNLLMAAMIGLVNSSGLFALEAPTKASFVDTHENSLRSTVRDYMLGYFAVYSSIPVVSAACIKLCTGAPLKNSMIDFKAINRDAAKGLLKTIPVTAPIVCAHYSLKKNILDNNNF